MTTNNTNTNAGDQEAAEIIRDKLSRIYGEEPGALKELQESKQASHRSKHQQFMFDLSASGKNLASIQTEWHNYYQNLPANEKHQVWQEFYSSQSIATGQPGASDHSQVMSAHKHQAAVSPQSRGNRGKRGIKASVAHRVSAGGKLQAKHHLQSLLFGLGMGSIVLIILLFGFFNEVVLAPFIQPGRSTISTPLIIGNDTVAPTANPEVIIPKINVEIPVDYSQTTTDESTIEKALENGVVHYPTTSLPGEVGNSAFFGHSSNNIFNKGKYKFAFVLLHTLELGDTFYLAKDSKVYVYKVITKNVVEPSEIGVLGPVPGQVATATLITCDPPGTSLKRLIVVGQQISPDPAGNIASTSSSVASGAPTALPGNGPTLFGRAISTTVGKIAVVVVLLAIFAWTVRWINKPLRRY
jgi:LPXTG-site transpeptidase (sortase) family protein